MAVIESPESIGVRPFHEFDEANAVWPRGKRLEAIRAAAREFRGRFKDQGQVTGVRTIDLVSAGYPVRYAFGGAAKGALNPYINILNRLVVVRFDDFEGESKTLVWEPTVPEGSIEAPYLRPAGRALRRVAVHQRSLEAVQHRRSRHSRAAGSRPPTWTS